MNPSTLGHCDPGLYDIYKADTECADAHSSTAKMVFVDSVCGHLYDLEMEDGSHIKLYQNMEVKVKRNGTEMKVSVPELQDEDDIIEIDYK